MSNLFVSNIARRRGVFRAADQSYVDFLADKWTTVCLHAPPPLNAQVEVALDELRDVLLPWGARRIGPRCAYPSYVSDDGFPAEMSLSWRQGRMEVRTLFESLGGEPTAHSSQEAGRALTRRLAASHRAALDQYLKIEDLFVTDDPAEYRPTVWHSLAWRPGRPPRYKVYLNPQVRGRDRADELVTEAMRRLGLSAAWRPVQRRASELADRGNEIEFLALDLWADRAARAKIYYRHHPMPLSELNVVASLARLHDAERATRVVRTIYGQDDGMVTNEPMTHLALRPGADRPEEANLYLRLPGNVDSDADAAERIAAVMRSEGVDPSPYSSIVAGLSPEPLHEMSGLQELFSYRTIARGRPADLGVYFRFSTYDSPAG